MSFEQALRASGLLPKVIMDDGKWRRCATVDKPRKRNGAYILHADGRGYWRNWATDDGINSYAGDKTTNARPIDPARVQAQRERDRQYRMQATQSARHFWNEASPLSMPHQYLEAKTLTPVGCKGLRIHDGLLVVPVMLGDRLISVQTISIEGEKRFWPGASVKAGCFALRRERTPVTVFCEGLATGLAVFQAVRSASVIVCFDAGNLLPVIERMKPTGSICIAADNDWRTKIKRGTNPGLEKARNAAELIGAGVAYPDGIEGSDWADFLYEIGPSANKRIERAILGKAQLVMGVDVPP